MKKLIKKKSKNYPLMAFRLTSETNKEALLNQINTLVEKMRKKQPEDERQISKGDVISEALLIGLESLEKKHLP
jgi:hypothetical protein